MSGSEIQHKRRQTREDRNKEGGRFTRFVKSRPEEGWTEMVVDGENQGRAVFDFKLLKTLLMVGFASKWLLGSVSV